MKKIVYFGLAFMFSILLFSIAIYYGWLAQTYIPKSEFYAKISTIIGISSYIVFGIAVAASIWGIIRRKRK